MHLPASWGSILERIAYRRHHVVVYGLTSNSTAYLRSQNRPRLARTACKRYNSNKSSPAGDWNKHGKPNTEKDDLTILKQPDHGSELCQQACNQAIPLQQQQRTHTADAAGTSSHAPAPPESVTLYVSKPSLKNGVIKYCRKGKNSYILQ